MQAGIDVTPSKSKRFFDDVGLCFLDVCRTSAGMFFDDVGMLFDDQMGASVGVGMLRVYHNVSWKSQRFKSLTEKAMNQPKGK